MSKKLSRVENSNSQEANQDSDFDKRRKLLKASLAVPPVLMSMRSNVSLGSSDTFNGISLSGLMSGNLSNHGHATDTLNITGCVYKSSVWKKVYNCRSDSDSDDCSEGIGGGVTIQNLLAINSSLNLNISDSSDKQLDIAKLNAALSELNLTALPDNAYANISLDDISRAVDLVADGVYNLENFHNTIDRLNDAECSHS